MTDSESAQIGVSQEPQKMTDGELNHSQVKYVDGSVCNKQKVSQINKVTKHEVSQSMRIYTSIKQRKLLAPPLNFCLVEDRIYRSGFPMPSSYPFLEELGLKTIVYLGDLGYNTKKTKAGDLEIMENYKTWISTTDITFHHLPMQASQEPFTSDDNDTQAKESLRIALQLVLDKNNYPMLIHSNKGKHRIGVLVGLMRKIFQGWCMSGIFEEYEKFALGKSEYDLEFIELWQPELTYNIETKPGFLRCIDANHIND